MCFAAAFALAGAVVLLPLACGSFGAADADGDGGALDARPAEAAPAPADCFDLTKPAGVVGFEPTMENGARALPSAQGLGLQVDYPATNGTRTTAFWRRTVAVDAGATAVALRIQATMDLPNGEGAPGGWYATFAGISHGDATALEPASFVHVAFAHRDATSATLDMNLFPGGTANNVMPATSVTFATVPSGHHDVSLFADVTWSTLDGMNSFAQLESGGSQLIRGATLQGSAASSWTVYLGGVAQSQPMLSLVYKKVCITVR